MFKVNRWRDFAGLRDIVRVLRNLADISNQNAWQIFVTDVRGDNLVPTSTVFCESLELSKANYSSAMSCREPLTIRLSALASTMPLTFELSLIIALTFAQF